MLNWSLHSFTINYTRKSMKSNSLLNKMFTLPFCAAYLIIAIALIIWHAPMEDQMDAVFTVGMSLVCTSALFLFAQMLLTITVGNDGRSPLARIGAFVFYAILVALTTFLFINAPAAHEGFPGDLARSMTMNYSLAVGLIVGTLHSLLKPKLATEHAIA